MSSILSSHAVVVATAMVVSGTVILLALRRQKYHFAFTPTVSPTPRPCISSGGKNGPMKKKKKKKVKFAEDVVDNGRGEQEIEGSARICSGDCGNRDSWSSKLRGGPAGYGREIRGMPANRAALYSGIMRDRGVHRFACAY